MYIFRLRAEKKKQIFTDFYQKSCSVFVKNEYERSQDRTGCREPKIGSTVNLILIYTLFFAVNYRVRQSIHRSKFGQVRRASERYR